MDSEEHVKVVMEAQETNPFHALWMDEDEESDDEDMEEMEEMQISPGWLGQRSPHHPATK